MNANKNEGCTSNEIERIAAFFLPNKLPVSYIDFLKRNGRKIAGVNSTFFHENGWMRLDSGYDFGQKMIDSSEKDLQLPKTSVVFGRDESGFVFFDLLAGDNPPVYGFRFCQMSTSFIPLADSFSEYMEDVKSGKPYPEIIVDAILIKKINQALNGESNDIETLELNYSIPEKIRVLINSQYGKEKSAIVLNIIDDFVKEKANYQENRVAYLEALLKISDGDLSRLQNIYLSYVLNPNFDPNVLVAQAEDKE